MLYVYGSGGYQDLGANGAVVPVVTLNPSIELNGTSYYSNGELSTLIGTDGLYDEEYGFTYKHNAWSIK